MHCPIAPVIQMGLDAIVRRRYCFSLDEIAKRFVAKAPQIASVLQDKDETCLVWQDCSKPQLRLFLSLTVGWPATSENDVLPVCNRT